MNPGDRVIIGLTSPNYLNGALGTFIRRQPGEHRTAVRLDNDPKYRRYAGKELCFVNACVSPDPSADGIFGLINTDIDARAQSAAPVWVEELARIIEAAVDEWAAEHWQHENYERIDHERWTEIYRPAMLWRYYTHLANELGRIGEGHESVLFNALKEGRG